MHAGEFQMPKRKTPEEKPKDQFKRFLEAAEEREIENEEVERAFAQMASPTKKNPKQ